MCSHVVHQQQATWVHHTSVDTANASLTQAPRDSCCYACQQMAIKGRLATCPHTGQQQGHIPCPQPRTHTISHVALSRPSPEQRSLVPSQSTGSSHCPSSATATEQQDPTYPRDSHSFWQAGLWAVPGSQAEEPTASPAAVAVSWAWWPVVDGHHY